jgi:hypothetical protein
MKRHQPALPAPDFVRSRPVWMLLLTLFLVPFFVRIPRSLNHHPVISPLGDQVHVLLFGGITLLLYWFGPLSGRIWWAAAGSALLGGTVEFLQLLVGRQALFKDFLLDVVGIALVVSFIYWRGHGRWTGKLVFWLIICAIPLQLYYVPWQIAAAYRTRETFPLLADFENFGDRYLWRPNQKAKLTFPRIEDSPTGPGSVLRVTGDSLSDWPGGGMRRFPADWSAYSTLMMEARMVQAPGETLRFGVRLDDYEGIKELAWIATPFFITDQWQTISVPISDRLLSNKKRNLNLTEMDRLIIYFSRPTDPVALEVDNIRLE